MVYFHSFYFFFIFIVLLLNFVTIININYNFLWGGGGGGRYGSVLVIGLLLPTASKFRKPRDHSSKSTFLQLQ